MDDSDDDSGEDQIEDSVEEGHARLPPLFGQAVCPLLRHGNLHIVTVFPKPTTQRMDQLVLLQQATHFAALAVVYVSTGRWRGCGAGGLAVGNPGGLGGCRRVQGGHINFHMGPNIITVLDQL